MAESRRSFLTPLTSNHGARGSDTSQLIVLNTGRIVATQRPPIRPPTGSDRGGTLNLAPRFRRSNSVPPKLKGKSGGRHSSGHSVPQVDRLKAAPPQEVHGRGTQQLTASTGPSPQRKTKLLERWASQTLTPAGDNRLIADLATLTPLESSLDLAKATTSMISSEPVKFGQSGQAPAGDGQRKPATAATARAYRADLRDLSGFCAQKGWPLELEQLDERRLFAYLASLVKAGRSPSTLRRRLTAFRAHVVEGGQQLVSVQELHALEDRLLKSAGSQTAALVVSDDTIIREGLAAVLARRGVLTWTDRTSDAIPGTPEIWDYVIVWLPSRRGIDPFSSVQWVAAASPTGVPIVTLYPGKVTDLVRLRLAEAGARYAVPQAWLSERVEELPQMLATASLPVRFHLETPLALRQKLGLHLSGQLQPLLAAAALLDDDVWRPTRYEDAPRVNRNEMQRLRRIASVDAGIPPPLGRYSTAVRSAPTEPDWREVRRVVRQAFNLR